MFRRFMTCDQMVMALGAVVVTMWAMQAADAQCAIWCKNARYYTDKVSSTDTSNKYYKVTSSTECKRIWHADIINWQDPIAGGAGYTRTAKEVTSCDAGLTAQCWYNGGGFGKCDPCTGNETLGMTDYSIACWQHCVPYPMP